MSGMSNFVLPTEAMVFNHLTAGSASSGAAGRTLSNGYYPTSGSFLSMSGYEGATFYVMLNDIADALDVEIYQSSTSGSTLSTPKAISGAAKKDVAATDDGKQFAITFDASQLDLANDFAYVSAKVSGISGTSYGDIVALRFKSGEQPVDQPASFYDDVIVVG